MGPSIVSGSILAFDPCLDLLFLTTRWRKAKGREEGNKSSGKLDKFFFERPQADILHAEAADSWCLEMKWFYGVPIDNQYWYLEDSGLLIYSYNIAGGGAREWG